MTTKRSARLLTVGLAIASAVALIVFANAGDFLPTEYYIVSIGNAQINVSQFEAAARADGITVVRVEGNSLTADTQDVAIDELLASDRLLLVDGDRIVFRSTATGFTYTVRPAQDGYEVVIEPTESLDRMTTLVDLLTDLQDIGVAGIDLSVDLTAIPSYASNAVKGPAAPDGIPIDSDLYGLLVSNNWFPYADSHRLTLVGLRVEVVAEKLPNGIVPAEYQSYVTSDTESLSKLLLPIEQVVALARSEGVGYVRPAYAAVAP